MEQEKKKSKTIKIAIAVITVFCIIGVIAFASTQIQKEAKRKEAEKQIEQAKEQLNEALSSLTPFGNSDNQSENNNSNEDNSQNSNIQSISSEEIEKLRKEQKLTCKSAKILVQDTKYKSLYPDMLTAKITNNTKETVKSYEVVFLAYDKNYLPVKIKGQFDSEGAYSKACLDDEANLIAGASTEEDYGWKLNQSHGITYIIACVKEAEFFNGEKWENPYIQYWLEKYEGKILPEDSRKGLIAYKNQ